MPWSKRARKRRARRAVVTGRGDFQVSYLTCTLNGETYFVPAYARSRPAAKAIVSGYYYEHKTHTLITNIMSRLGGNMLHAGTFFGDMLPSFARACPGTLYAFEPVLENYILAKLTVDANALESVMLFNQGLGPVTGTARIQTRDENDQHRGGSSRIAEDIPIDNSQPISVLAIDDLALKQLTLLQLDIEGAELGALQGAAKSIERLKPIIMVEDNKRACGPFLESKGYSPIGEIPGQTIWSPPAHQDDLKQMLAALDA